MCSLLFVVCVRVRACVLVCVSLCAYMCVYCVLTCVCKFRLHLVELRLQFDYVALPSNRHRLPALVLAIPGLLQVATSTKQAHFRTTVSTTLRSLLATVVRWPRVPSLLQRCSSRSAKMLMIWWKTMVI